MDFKFGFLENKNNQEENLTDDLKWYSAQEVQLIGNDQTLENKFLSFKKELCSMNKIKISYFNPNQIIENAVRNEIDSNLSDANKSHSDLIPSKYEGGYKIWECTFDLINYMTSENIEIIGKTVLDLGCGSGLLGILAKLQGAESVHFQDYNHSVLSSCTIPNIKINNIQSDDCKCFSGDWESFEELISKKKILYDIILTSETIYNSSNYRKLYSILKNLLKENGKIYLAAKTYYFGVGGGIKEFDDFVKKENILKSKVVWKNDQGMNFYGFELTNKIQFFHKFS